MRTITYRTKQLLSALSLFSTQSLISCKTSKDLRDSQFLLKKKKGKRVKEKEEKGKGKRKKEKERGERKKGKGRRKKKARKEDQYNFKRGNTES